MPIYPTSMTVNIGTLASGTVNDVKQSNDVWAVINENTGPGPVFDVEFLFESVSDAGWEFYVEGFYSGNPAHNVKIQIYNVLGTTWENVTAETKDMPSDSSDQTYDWALPNPLTNYLESGDLKMKIIHTSNGSAGHTLNLDEVRLDEADESSSSSSSSLSSSSLSSSSQSSVSSSSSSSVSSSSVSSSSVSSSSESSSDGTIDYPDSKTVTVVGPASSSVNWP